MPDLKKHKEISKSRTYNEFSELHEWIDESQKWLKENHRLERHSYSKPHEDFITEKWDRKAVVEWLFHIAIDNLETAQKKAFEVYTTLFDQITFDFEKGKIKTIKFRLNFADGKTKSIEYPLKTAKIK